MEENKKVTVEVSQALKKMIESLAEQKGLPEESVLAKLVFDEVERSGSIDEKQHKEIEITRLTDVSKIIGEEKCKEIVESTIDELTFNRKIEYYWDYSEIDSLKSDVLYAIKKIREDDIENRTAESNRTVEENKQKIFEKVYDDYLETFLDWRTQTTGIIFESIENQLRSMEEFEGYEFYFEEEFVDNEEILMTDFGLVFDDRLEEKIENIEFAVNVPIEIGDESNREYTNTMDLIRDMEIENELDANYQQIYENCGLAWLIYQQGYTLEDLIKNESLPQKEQSSFLSSVQNEIDNCPAYSQMKVYAMVQVDLDTYCGIVSKDGSNLEIRSDISSKYGSLGLYNPYIGSGSNLEIEPEKDLILSPEMIGRVQLEGIDNYGEYTINECYGLISDCWAKNCVKETDESEFTFTDYSIDIESVNKALKERKIEYDKERD